MEAKIITYATPVFFLLIFVEIIASRILKRDVYRVDDAINSISLGILFSGHDDQHLYNYLRSFFIFYTARRQRRRLGVRLAQLRLLLLLAASDGA